MQVPGITVAHAEGLNFKEYLDDKYTKDNPQSDPYLTVKCFPQFEVTFS
jgi:hypothetical protein